MKSVAIIGAGPSGLVAAKKCLLMYPGTFKVSLFEKQDRVGGLWAVDLKDKNKIMNPFMPTNLSKYSVSFSDLSWESVKISTNGETASTIPEFPKAWMVGQYLEQYRRKYIPAESLFLNCRVDRISEASGSDGGAHSKWKVEWTSYSNDSSPSKTKEELFDYVIIATGFLNNPIAARLGKSSKPGAKVIHSSQFRDLEDLVPEGWTGSGDILVYGGSMSGLEVAASVAYQISSRKYSPSTNLSENPKIYHVTSRPFYIFTPFASTDLSQRSPSFLPIDLVFFDLSSRPIETASASYGRMPIEQAQSFHGMFRLQTGGDQSDLNKALYASSTDSPPYFANATGTSYAEFVRSGDIVPIAGRVEEIDETDSGQSFKVKIDAGDSHSAIDNIVGAIHATGYRPDLEFLSKDVKELLDYDQANHRLPVVLTNAQTMNSSVPNLAFVGMHEGSFWGSEEAQSRIIVQTWATEDQSSSDTPMKIVESLTTTSDLRTGISDRSTDIPQFTYGDFVGHMEQCAQHGYATRDDGPWGGRNGPAIPARYTDSSDDLKEAKLTIEKLQDTVARASNQGLFVAKAVFVGFQGDWKVHREIKSALKSSPSGTFLGTAKFHPRESTSSDFDLEYLYVEDGDFKTDEGFSMKASRRYAYRYKSDDDQLTTWFIKADGKTVDYLFLDLAIRRETDENDFWIGTARHPCKPDTYDAKYTFQFNGMKLQKFTIEYRVTGPQKDYVSTSVFQR